MHYPDARWLIIGLALYLAMSRGRTATSPGWELLILLVYLGLGPLVVAPIAIMRLYEIGTGYE